MGPLLSAYTVYMRFDPMYAFCKIVARYDPYANQTTFGTRVSFRLVSFVILTITGVEAGRIMQLIAIIFTLGPYLFTQNVKLLYNRGMKGERTSTNHDIEASIMQYNRIVIVTQEMAEIQSTASLYLVKICSSAIVLCNYLTLKMYNSVPINIYVFAPTLTILLVIVLNISLRYAYQMSDMTENLVKVWGHVGARGGNKWVARRAKGMTPVRVYAGVWGYNLFQLDKDYMSQFNADVVDGTFAMLIAY